MAHVKLKCVFNQLKKTFFNHLWMFVFLFEFLLNWDSIANQMLNSAQNWLFSLGFDTDGFRVSIKLKIMDPL